MIFQVRVGQCSQTVQHQDIRMPDPRLKESTCPALTSSFIDSLFLHLWWHWDGEDGDKTCDGPLSLGLNSAKIYICVLKSMSDKESQRTQIADTSSQGHNHITFTFNAVREIKCFSLFLERNHCTIQLVKIHYYKPQNSCHCISLSSSILRQCFVRNL